MGSGWKGAGVEEREAGGGATEDGGENSSEKGAAADEDATERDDGDGRPVCKQVHSSTGHYHPAGALVSPGMVGYGV